VLLKASQLGSSKGLLVVVLLVVFWALAVVSRLLWNGDVYGLDFNIFHPDGRCYSQSAFDIAGESERGLRELNETYERLGYTASSLPSSMEIAEQNCSGKGLEARVLYPVLSAPFVKLFGSLGMLVVPALSWLLTILVPVMLLLRRGYFLGPSIAGGLAIASVTVSRWGVANIVDPLLMALVASTLLFLPIFRSPRKWDLLGLALLAVGGALTRQSFPIWIAIALGPWIAWHLKKKNRSETSVPRKNPWTWPLVVLTGTSLASWRIIDSVLGSQNPPFLLNNWIEGVSAAANSTTQESIPQVAQSLPALTNESSNTILNFHTEVWETSRHSLSLAFEVLYTEFGQLFVLDRALVVLLALAILGVWRFRGSVYSHIFPSVFLTTLALGAINSTVGINFRLQLSAIPFAIFMAALAIQPLPEKNKL